MPYPCNYFSGNNTHSSKTNKETHQNTREILVFSFQKNSKKGSEIYPWIKISYIKTTKWYCTVPWATTKHYEWYYESLRGNTSVTTMYYEVLLVVLRITMRYYEKFKGNAHFIFLCNPKNHRQMFISWKY